MRSTFCDRCQVSIGYCFFFEFSDELMVLIVFTGNSFGLRLVSSGLIGKCSIFGVPNIFFFFCILIFLLSPRSPVNDTDRRRQPVRAAGRRVPVGRYPRRRSRGSPRDNVLRRACAFIRRAVITVFFFPFVLHFAYKYVYARTRRTCFLSFYSHRKRVETINQKY